MAKTKRIRNGTRPEMSLDLSLTSVNPVNIQSATWVNMGMAMWSYHVTVRATIATPASPPGCILVSKVAFLKKGGVTITPELPLIAVSGNVYEATFILPEGIVSQGDTLQAWAKVVWQTTFQETGNSVNHNVPAHA